MFDVDDRLILLGNQAYVIYELEHMQIIAEVIYYKAFGFAFENALGIHKAGGSIVFGHDDKILRCGIEND